MPAGQRPQRYRNGTERIACTDRVATFAVMEPPRPADYPAYYESYVAQVPTEPLDVLQHHLDGIAGLRTVDDERSRYRYAPGKWSVRELLGHLCDGERIFGYRAMRIARGDATPLAGFDEDAYVTAAHFDTRPWENLLDELQAVRTANLTLFRSFDAEALERRGTANGGAVTPRAIVWIVAGHAIHHHRVLRERYGILLP